MNDWKRIAVVVMGVALLLLGGFGIKGAIDSDGATKSRLYNTSLQITDGKNFNYAVDTHQGRVIASGPFAATGPVKFPEMSKSFAYVNRTLEHYTMHTREDCTTDSEGHESCHTEVYYTWDYQGSDELSTPSFKLYDRDYPATTFDLGDYKHNADACDFTAADTSGWFQSKKGCDGGYYYLDSDDRYDYDVVDTNFTASMILDTGDGSLKPMQGDGAVKLSDKSPSQIVSEATNYKGPGIAFIIVWFVFMIGGAGALAYAWVMADGGWSNEV